METDFYEEITEGAPSKLPLKARMLVDVLHEKYAHLILQSEVLLLIVNEDLTIEFMSNTFCDLLHYPSQSLIDKSIFSVIAPESHKDIENAIESIRNHANKSHRVHDLALYCAFGHQHFFDGLVINLHKDESIGGYLFYLHNATERRKIETQLKDLNLELDSFVYKASHDLRAPLASLSGLISLTESDFPLGARENFDMMKSSVHKLDKFIKQLAHYSRNNNTEADYSEIDFQSLIEEVINTYKYLDNADKIHFEIIIKAEKVIISDAFRLKVILSNLISNAIKYHRVKQEFPFIKIKVEANDAAFVIVIEDNGIGINKHYIDKIFNMFTRATDYSDGSGLGLYIVKKALEKLNGEIKVSSKEGKGSIFEVITPNN